jgi:hypothetical protein
MPRREPRRKRERYSVFLNISYDSAFENLYLAYIAGLSAFGLIPRATLEIPTSRRKLERILSLLEDSHILFMTSCEFSSDTCACLDDVLWMYSYRV